MYPDMTPQRLCLAGLCTVYKSPIIWKLSLYEGRKGDPVIFLAKKSNSAATRLFLLLTPHTLEHAHTRRISYEVHHNMGNQQ